jgi:uncharacterized protein (TIGR01777 family)
MHYLITGGTGFIGTALTARLTSAGHRVTVLTRQRRPDQGQVSYIDELAALPAATVIDCVVNLAGASLAGARWSAAYKQTIIESRLQTTGHVVDLIQRLEHKPPVLLSASAIGYYGHHGDEVLDEEGAVAPGFSHELCRQWEAAACAAEGAGVRVCRLRLGVVLDADGGALEEMARPFHFGVANWLGDGSQWLSWVHREDVVNAIRFLHDRSDLRGPFNITAPEPVTSRGFCAALKQHYRTWLTAPVPAPVMRLMVGEMAEELLLQGQRVVPARLQDAGFTFAYPSLESALRAIHEK